MRETSSSSSSSSSLEASPPGTMAGLERCRKLAETSSSSSSSSLGQNEESRVDFASLFRWTKELLEEEEEENLRRENKCTNEE